MAGYGIYGTQAEELLSTPVAPSAPSPTFATPAIGSPELKFDSELLSAPRSYSRLTPEELERLKWSNWSETNGFNTASPAVQRDMLNQYYNNVLPQVADTAGVPVEHVQQRFAIRYPTEARLLGEASSVEQKYHQALQAGLDERSARLYSLGSKIDDLVPSQEITFKRDQYLELGFTEDQANKLAAGMSADNVFPEAEIGLTDRLAEMAEYEKQAEEFGFGLGMTDAMKREYILNGKVTASIPKAEAMPSPVVVEQTRIGALEATNDVMRAVNQALGTLNVELSADGKQVLGRGSIFRLPRSGPMGEWIANNFPWATDASKLRGVLDTVKSQVFLDTLTTLKSMSATGASGLGQVTHMEITMLQSSLASLNEKRLDDPTLAANLIYVLDRIVQMKSRLADTSQATPAIPEQMVPRADPATTPAQTGGDFSNHTFEFKVVE